MPSLMTKLEEHRHIMTALSRITPKIWKKYDQEIWKLQASSAF
jgi:hypothetical protein